ncbi:MAG: GIY-YIG nuclease family protein [Candidatus Thiodiazotropha sp. DIVDIV]
MGESRDNSWYVYILRCSDNTLYTGVTNDITRRVSEHNRGIGAKYTRGRTPVELVFLESSSNRSTALRRECVIKKMKLAEKQKIIDQAVVMRP